MGQVFNTTAKVAERGLCSANSGSDTVERKGIKTILREDSAQVGSHFQSRVVEGGRPFPHIILPLSSIGEATKKMVEVGCLGIPIMTGTFAVTGKRRAESVLDTLIMRGVDV